MNKKSLNVLNLKDGFKNNKKLHFNYCLFKNNLKDYKKNSFLVAVSGGSDSLALSALAKAYQHETKVKIFYALIDHGIRKKSYQEAKSVKKILKVSNINLEILKNNKKINTNIQSKAREIRYKLLTDYCKKKKIKLILSAHHKDDQVETFLIRLSRGSGVQGLSSMQMVTPLNKNIKLIRPLLNIDKKELSYITKKIFKKFIKDPSNKNTKFLRTKVRGLKRVLEKSGIYYDQIIKSINNLSSTRDTLNSYVRVVYKNIVIKDKKVIKIKYKNFFKENNEIRLRILGQAIKECSNSYYPPRSKKLQNLIKLIQDKKHSKSNLAGCIVGQSKLYINLKKNAQI